MTLRRFARAAGTSASRLSDYENAKVAPTTDMLGRLGHVAGMNPGIPGFQRASDGALRTLR
jgi:transcriptional regulator with XRE-family HTH domain